MSHPIIIDHHEKKRSQWRSKPSSTNRLYTAITIITVLLLLLCTRGLVVVALIPALPNSSHYSNNRQTTRNPLPTTMSSSVSYSNWQNEPNASYSSSNGPRAKCDQVIFEAIAKATEIVVNGRAAGGQTQRIFNHQHQQDLEGDNIYSGGGHGHSNSNNNSSSSSSNSSRFNLTVPENPGVR